MTAIELSREAFEKAQVDLSRVCDDLYHQLMSNRTGKLDAGTTRMPGLDALAISHGAVVGEAVGSAINTLSEYRNQIGWAADAVGATKSAIFTQDVATATRLNGILEHFAFETQQVRIPERPEADFADFGFGTPVAGSYSSISDLSSDLNSTNIGDFQSAQDTWEKLSSEVTSYAQRIRAVADNIRDNNEGESIDSAVAKITDIANAADTFAANATSMAMSVNNVINVYEQASLDVALASMQIALIEDPVEKEAAEKAYLDSFTPSFDRALQGGVPTIRNLMATTLPGGEGAVVAITGREAAVPSTLSQNASSIAAAEGFQGPAALAAQRDGNAVGAGSFAAVANNTAPVAGLDAHATHAQGLGTATAGGVTAANPVSGLGTGGGAAHGLAAGQFGAPVPLGNQRFGTSGTNSGAMAGVGNNRLTGGANIPPVNATTPQSASLTAPKFGAEGSAMTPGVMHPGLGRNRNQLGTVQGGSGFGGAGSSGAGSGGFGGSGTGGGAGIGAVRAGSFVAGGANTPGRSIIGGGTGGAGSYQQTGMATNAAATGQANGGAGTGRTGATPMMAGAPMGARGGTPSNKQRRMKASDIEREQNMRDLLGPPIMYAPSVITNQEDRA